VIKHLRRFLPQRFERERFYLKYFKSFCIFSVLINAYKKTKQNTFAVIAELVSSEKTLTTN